MEINYALKRAIIKTVPDYFGWNTETQEQYRVNTPEEDALAIRQYLLQSLFDITVTNQDDLDAAWDGLTIEQGNVINPVLLPLQGIGEDYFYLNEFLQKHQTLLSFPTLYDYDIDDFRFQEEWREKDIKGYKRKQYRGALYFTWARLMVDGEFTYGVLSMAAGYIFSQVDEFGSDYIEKLIPYTFQEGKEHGKKEGECYRWDMKRVADGLEQQLDELFIRFHSRLQEVYERLLDEFDAQSKSCVFIIDSSQYGDREYQFLFSDTTVLKQIRLKRFIHDCRAAEQKNHLPLTQKIEDEKELMHTYIDEQYHDIMENINYGRLNF